MSTFKRVMTTLSISGIRPDERGRALLLTLHNVSVIAVVIAGKSVRDAYFLSRFDKSTLPLMMVAVAVAIAFVVPLYRKVASRYRSELLLPGTALLFAASLFVIRFKLEGWTIPVLYIGMEVITVIAALQFWLLASDVLDPRQAKRLFPMIGGGGSFAAMLVGSQLKPLTKAYGSEALLWLVCGLLVAVSVVSAVTTRLPRAPVPQLPAQPRVKTRRKPLGPYLRAIALLVVSAAVVATVIDYQFKIISSSTLAKEEDLIGFFGQFYAITGFSTLILQFVFARVLFSRFGIVAALLVLPISLGLSSITILAWPLLGAVVMGKFADQTFRFTLHNNGLELLWLPISGARRREARPTITGILKSATEGLSGIGIFLLVKFMTAAQLSYFAVIFIGVWIFAILRLRKLYVKELQSAIERHQIPIEDLEIDTTDVLTVAVIEQALSSGDPIQQLFALDLVKGFQLEPWSSTLRRLLEEGSSEVRAQILDLAAEDPSIVTEQYLEDAICEKGASAVHAIRIVGRLQLSQFSEQLRQTEEQGDSAIRAASFAARIRLGDLNQPEPGAQLRRMMASPEAAERAAAIEESASLEGLITTDLVVSALSDPAASVRSKALAIAAGSPDERYIPLIVECMKMPGLRLAARTALTVFPASAILSSLAAELEHESPIPERRLIVRAFRSCPIPQVFPVLLGAMNEYQPSVSDDASDALLSVRRCGSPADIYNPLVSNRWNTLVRTAYGLTQALHLLPDQPETRLLRDYVDNSLRQILPALMRLSALKRPDVPVDTCIQIFLAGDRARLPFVLELLDAVLPLGESRQIGILLEPLPLDVRVAVGRKYFPDMPSRIDEWLLRAIHSGNEWLSAIALEYALAAADEAPAFIEWNRISYSPLVSETVLECVRRKPALAAAIAMDHFAPHIQEVPHMLTTLEKTLLLKSVGLFKEISAEDLSYVAGIAEEVEVNTGVLIFSEGEYGDCLYIIIGGSVRIHKGEHELAILGRLQALGEMAVLDGSPRSASATAQEDTQMLKVGREQFLDVMRNSPEIMQGIIRLLLARLREADEKLSKD